MKKIIDRKVFDTKKSERLAGEYFSNPNDFNYQFKELHRSPKGTLFFYAGGGPGSDYAVKIGSNEIGGSTKMWLPELDEAIDWLAEVDPNKALELFPEHFEEG